MQLLPGLPTEGAGRGAVTSASAVPRREMKSDEAFEDDPSYEYTRTRVSCFSSPQIWVNKSDEGTFEQNQAP